MQVSASVGYSKWAASYDETLNPVLALESRILPSLLSAVSGKRVLDAGCGTGRWMQYLADHGARVWGVDSCEPMLSQGRRKQAVVGRCLGGDLSCLPFPDDSFDLALCSLTLSYTPDIQRGVAELARVAPTVIITDLHPEAMRRGWTRSFREDGKTWHIDHFPYTAGQLVQAAKDAGLAMTARIDAVFGEPEREIFDRAGKASAFEAVSNYPALLITRWTR